MARKGDIYDYIMLLRPTLMMPVWMFMFYGHYSACCRGLRGFALPSETRFWLAMLAITLISGTAYIVNQIFDIETDRINRKLFLLPDGIISVKAAWTYLAVLSVAGLAIAFSLGKTPFLLIFTIWVTGFMYSVPPFRFKGKPIIDMVWNSIGYGLLTFLLGYWTCADKIDSNAILNSIVYMLSVAGVYAETTIADIEGDRADGAITIGVLMGKKATAVVGAVLMAASAVVAFLLHNWIGFIPALITFLLFLPVPAAGERLVSKAKFAFRLAGGIYALNIGIHYPIYILMGAVVYAAMKIYYKNRFGLNYPSLSED